MYLRFYHDISHDGKLGKLKWTPVSIHQMDLILSNFQISNVLDGEYDKRKTKIDRLKKKQMIEECQKLGLDHTGNKVKSSQSIHFK